MTCPDCGSDKTSVDAMHLTMYCKACDTFRWLLRARVPRVFEDAFRERR